MLEKPCIIPHPQAKWKNNIYCPFRFSSNTLIQKLFFRFPQFPQYQYPFYGQQVMRQQMGHMGMPQMMGQQMGHPMEQQMGMAQQMGMPQPMGQLIGQQMGMPWPMGQQMGMAQQMGMPQPMGQLMGQQMGMNPCFIPQSMMGQQPAQTMLQHGMNPQASHLHDVEMSTDSESDKEKRLD